MSELYRQCTSCNGYTHWSSSKKPNRCICHDPIKIAQDVHDLYPKAILKKEKRVEDLVPLIDCVMLSLDTLLNAHGLSKIAWLNSVEYKKARIKFYEEN